MVEEINREDNVITTNQEMAGFGFKCDCTAADEGRKCDADYDGRFEGACEGGECNDVI